MRINENFMLLPESYLFSKVARKIDEYKASHPDADVIRMDIGDVTLPLPSTVVKAMHVALDEMAVKETLRGYGPEQGYLFLRKAISDNDYKARGIDIDADDIFISDGAKSDLGNLGDIYSGDCIVAVTNPGYPVYADANVMGGRTVRMENDSRKGLIFLDCNASNGFKPSVPSVHADVVFLCSPSNPTGAAFTKDELKEWVLYAKKNEALIIYDSAYEAYVRDPMIVRSIYEIEGADEVAIEVRSFSKTAGFTGVRCGYTVVPKSLYGKDSKGGKVMLKKLWNRRQCTKFNGVGYIVQRGAEALYSAEGKEEIRRNIDYYLENARLIRAKMQEAGFEVFGGENSPYVWARFPGCIDSWELFNKCLENSQLSCTPGVGFGSEGEGYIRLTGFNSREKTIAAMERMARGFKH